MRITRACGLLTLFVTLPCLVVGVPLGLRDLVLPGLYGLAQCLVLAVLLHREARSTAR